MLTLSKGRQVTIGGNQDRIPLAVIAEQSVAGQGVRAMLFYRAVESRQCGPFGRILSSESAGVDALLDPYLGRAQDTLGMEGEAWMLATASAKIGVLSSRQQKRSTRDGTIT